MLAHVIALLTGFIQIQWSQWRSRYVDVYLLNKSECFYQKRYTNVPLGSQVLHFYVFYLMTL